MAQATLVRLCNRLPILQVASTNQGATHQAAGLQYELDSQKALRNEEVMLTNRLERGTA